MQRHRTIAAAPIRTASEAWLIVVQLITDTLERSPAIPNGAVAAELAPLDGLGPALVAAGHLETIGLVLADQGLHLTIIVVTGDRALDVDENLNPVPGGATATHGWMLYLPSPDPLATAISAAAAKSAHLSIESPPATAPDRADEAVASSEGVLDLDAIRNLESRP